MADMALESVQRLPRIEKQFVLKAGQKIADNAEVLAFSQKTVPAGKKASVYVTIQVLKLENA